MKTSRYYSHELNRRIDPGKDGCPLDRWTGPGGSHLLALHPAGFPVFLSPERLVSMDEYAQEDPYQADRASSPFQARRTACIRDLLRLAAPQLDHTPSVLDLGCGTGTMLALVREELPTCALYGLDCSVTAVERAAQRFPDGRLCVADAHQAPYAPGSFDLVLCSNLWEHVPDPLRLLARVRLVLKPGGFLALSTPSRFRTENVVRLLTGRSLDMMSRYHVTEYSAGQVREQLAFGGFQTVAVLSRPVKRERFRTALVRTLHRSVASLVGQRHQAESTLFFLARAGTQTHDQ